MFRWLLRSREAACPRDERCSYRLPFRIEDHHIDRDLFGFKREALGVEKGRNCWFRRRWRWGEPGEAVAAIRNWGVVSYGRRMGGRQLASIDVRHNVQVTTQAFDREDAAPIAEEPG
jgi:hypothetical protein